MDPIEHLMKNAKPRVQEPGTIPGTLSDRSEVFSTDPNVVSLAQRKTQAQRKPRRTFLATAGVVLAAAAVVGAVVVSANLVPQSAPAPATTTTPTVSATPTPTPTATPSATVTPSATPSPTPTLAPTTPPASTAVAVPSTPVSPAAPSTAAPPPATPAGPAAGACTVANIDIQRNDQVRAIKPIPAEHQQYYTVLGCAEGWVAYSISDDGIRAIGLDGGNAWYNVGKLQANGRYLTEFGQLWASIYNWESLGYAVQNGQFATVQQGMDKEFADKGIPVRLRTQLVGAGPAAPKG